MKDIGERLLARGGALRADGQRLAEIGHALLQMDKPLVGVPGRRLGSDVLEEIERAWPALRSVLVDRLLDEGMEIQRRWPVLLPADGLTEV